MYIEERFNELVYAIIYQAALDFGEFTAKMLKPTQRYSREIAERELNGIREFFTSERFELMTDMDGREILSKLEANPFMVCKGNGRRYKINCAD